MRLKSCHSLRNPYNETLKSSRMENVFVGELIKTPVSSSTIDRSFQAKRDAIEEHDLFAILPSFFTLFRKCCQSFIVFVVYKLN